MATLRPSGRLPLGLLLSTCIMMLLLITPALGASSIRSASSAAAAAAADAAGSKSGRGSNSTLVCVQVVSRHGTRAPNPVVAKLCPADRPNLALYGKLRITLAGLTGTGMSELHDLGVYARQQYMERTYPGFLNTFFNDQEVYFRAVGEDRTLQSAVAMAQGMYPAGSTPLGYRSDVPSPVPVYTLPDVYDYLLEARKQACKARLSRDSAAWDATEGLKLYKSHQGLLGRLHSLCNITDLNDMVANSGVAGATFGDAIKDITDAWSFDMIEGFPMPEGLNTSSLLEFRTMAVAQLNGRTLGTDEQITYLNGELPERMLDNFLYSVWNQGPEHAADFALKFYAYHGHREMLYALGAFLGLRFNISYPALPVGAIPPGATLFFELHYLGPRDAQGEIPNAFTAAGMKNPYAAKKHGGGEGGYTPSTEPPTNGGAGYPLLPWQQDRAPVHRKSASQVIKDRPAQHEHEPKPSDAKDAEQEKSDKEDGKEEDDSVLLVPSVSISNADLQAAAAAAAGGDNPFAPEEGEPTHVGQYGSYRLSKGNGPPFKVIPPAEESDQGADADADAADAPDEGSSRRNPKYKYLPRSSASPRTGSPSNPVPPQVQAGQASTWRPAPPTDGYVVRAMLWIPCKDLERYEEREEAEEEAEGVKSSHRKSRRRRRKQSQKARRQAEADPSTPDCPAVPLAMHEVCDARAEDGCPLADLSAAIHRRLTRTGTWDQLCDVRDLKRIMADTQGVEQAAREQMAEASSTILTADASSVAAAFVPAAPSPPASRSLLRSFLALLCVAPLALVAYALFIKIRQYEYTPAGEGRFRHQEQDGVEVAYRGLHQQQQQQEDEESRPFVQRVY